MKIKFTTDFQQDLIEIVRFIALDKPKAARKFKNDLIKNIQNELVSPYSYKKSIYFEEEKYRDYVFKGYTTICEVDLANEIVNIIGVLKYRDSFNK